MGSKIEGSGCVLVVWKWFVDPLLALPSITECVYLLLGPSRRGVQKRYRGRLTILCNNMERCKSKLGWVRLIDSLWGFKIKWWHELTQKYSPAAVMQLCGLKKVRNVINRYLELISRLCQKFVGMSRFSATTYPVSETKTIFDPFLKKHHAFVLLTKRSLLLWLSRWSKQLILERKPPLSKRSPTWVKCWEWI